MDNDLKEEGTIDDKVDTYTPDETSKLEYTQLPKEATEYADDFDSIADDDGNIRAELHSETILRTLAERIYNDPNSAIRELYNNEARACRTARDKYNAKPKIRITMNSVEKSLVIQGIDSLGITKAVFSQVLRIVGKSGNLSGGEVGQFGMGFISYALLTDMMLLETFARETKQQYGFICDVGMVFRKAPKPDLDTFGTKLTLALKSDVDMSELVATIKKCALLSTVPTDIVLEEDVEDSYKDIEYPSGLIECEQYENIREYELCREDSTILPFINDNYHVEAEYEDLKGKKTKKWIRQEAIDYYKEFHLDKPDYEFFGVIATTITPDRKESRPLGMKNNTNKCFLLGTPIKLNSSSWEDKYDVDRVFYNMGWVLNIKDERKYQPEANRDTLSRKASESIIEQVGKDFKELFQQFNLTSVDEYNNSLDKPIYNRQKFWSLVSTHVDGYTSDIIDTLNRRYPMQDNSYGYRLSSLLETSDQIVALKSLRSDLMTLLRSHIYENNKLDVDFIRAKHHSDTESLKQFGVIIGEEYKKEHKLKLKRDGVKGSTVDTDSKPCVIWNSGWYSANGKSNQLGAYNWNRRSKNRRCVSSTFGQVNARHKDSNIYSVPPSMSFKDEAYRLTRDYHTDIKLVKERRGLNCQSITDKITSMGIKKQDTSLGKMQLSTWLKELNATKTYHHIKVIVLKKASGIDKLSTDDRKIEVDGKIKTEHSYIVVVPTQEERIFLERWFKMNYYYQSYHNVGEKHVKWSLVSNVNKLINNPNEINMNKYPSVELKLEAIGFFKEFMSDETEFTDDFKKLIMSNHNGSNSSFTARYVDTLLSENINDNYTSYFDQIDEEELDVEL